MNCYAHTIQNAAKAGLILSGADEYGIPEWIGTREQWAQFNLAEVDAQLL